MYSVIDKLYGVDSDYRFVPLFDVPPGKGVKMLVSSNGDVVCYGIDFDFYRFHPRTASFQHRKTIDQNSMDRLVGSFQQKFIDFENGMLEVESQRRNTFVDIETLERDSFLRDDFVNPFDRLVSLSTTGTIRRDNEIIRVGNIGTILGSFTGPTSVIVEENRQLFRYDWGNGVVTRERVNHVSWELSNGIVVSREGNDFAFRYHNVVSTDSFPGRYGIVDLKHDIIAFMSRTKLVIYKCQTLESQVEKIQDAIEVVEDEEIRRMLSVVGENLALEQRRQTLGMKNPIRQQTNERGVVDVEEDYSRRS
jgi:hypothetical protein